MRSHQPLPRRWLMTDERATADLWSAVLRLPPGSGIVFRHYDTPAPMRRRLLRRLARIAVARRLLLLSGGPAVGGPVAGRHNPPPGRVGARDTGSVHNVKEASRARRIGYAAVFVSPVFITASHVDRPALGHESARRLAKAARCPAIALGGMTERRFRRLSGFHGWAAIDAWRQKRNAVPT